ncbi:MAG: hypothetical protein WD749_12720 [Phycisphaerales bacterium]
MPTPPTTPGERPPIALLDPGWLYLLAGISLLAATVVIPALGDLDDVQLERDRLLAIEQHRGDRLIRYRDYLDTLERQEPQLVMALAASQLNLIPQGRTIALQTPDLLTAPQRAGLIFASLEPPPLVLPEPRPRGSLLERWTGSDAVRPWLIAAGALCLLMGLLPRADLKPPAEDAAGAP